MSGIIRDMRGLAAALILSELEGVMKRDAGPKTQPVETGEYRTGQTPRVYQDEQAAIFRAEREHRKAEAFAQRQSKKGKS